MDARTYVYAYLLLSAVYAAACLQYIATVSRTRTLARALSPEDPATSPTFDSEEAVEESRTAIRAVLGIDSAAFACAALPVAYLGVTGILANLVSRNVGAAGSLNLLWLAASVALVAAHMFFVVRIVGYNTELEGLDRAVLSPSFVSRHTSMLTYYRTLVLVVTAFNVLNTLWMVVNISKITLLPFVV
jgi:hypothetical protein